MRNDNAPKKSQTVRTRFTSAESVDIAFDGSSMDPAPPSEARERYYRECAEKYRRAVAEQRERENRKKNQA